MAVTDGPDWEMFANSDRTFQATLVDQDNVAFNLSGYTCRMEIKVDEEIATVAYITKSTTSGTQASITDAAGGVVQFYIIPEDFTTAPVYNRPYHYAVKIRHAVNDREYTAMKGTVRFKKPVFTAVT